MASYLHSVQEEGILQELAKVIRFQRCILLIGLGLAVSSDADEESPQKHLKEFLRRMIRWCMDNQVLPPGEVSDDFQNMLKNGELAKAERKMQEYVTDPQQRRQCINDVLNQNQLQIQHIYELFARMSFRAYLTTSYDEFLETAYKGVKEFPELEKFYTASIEDAILTYRAKQPLILKLHGDIAADSPEKITLSNRFARSYLPGALFYPEQVRELLANEHALFVGFEKVDPDFEGLKHVVNKNDSLKRWLLMPEGHLTEDEARLLYEEDKLTTLYYANQSDLLRFLQKLQEKAATSQQVHVYTSYASRDKQMRKRIQKHLSNVKCEGLKITWTDGEILPGQDVTSTREERLKRADIMLLLVSADYLDSMEESNVGLEIARAVQRHNKGQARVIPILLRSCGWEDAPFARLSVLPENKLPIDLAPHREQVYTEIRKAIKAAIEDWAEKH